MKQKRDHKKEVRVGILITLGLVIIVGAVFSVGGSGDLFGKKVRYVVYFNSTNGLYKGDPVLLTGVEVGNVIDISFPEDLRTMKIKVVLEVSSDAAKRVRADTRATVASASIVYGKVVELTMGSFDQPQIPDGGEIPAGDKAGINSILSSTSDVMLDIKNVMKKISKGDGALGMILNDESQLQKLVDNLNNASNSLAVLLSRTEKGEGAFGVLMSDSLKVHGAVENLTIAAENLKKLSKKLQSKKTLFGKFVNDEKYGEKVSADLDRLVSSIANISAKIDTGNSSAAMLINDNALYRGLEDVVFGIKKSKLATWYIRSKRKSGEKLRKKQEK